MKGIYYRADEEHEMVLVPYLFTGRIEKRKSIRICIEPSSLERVVVVALRSDSEYLREMVSLGLWREFEVSGKSIEDMVLLCSIGKYYWAGKIASQICCEVINMTELG